jgi:hypothetical protein
MEHVVEGSSGLAADIAVAPVDDRIAAVEVAALADIDLEVSAVAAGAEVVVLRILGQRVCLVSSG